MSSHDLMWLCRSEGLLNDFFILFGGSNGAQMYLNMWEVSRRVETINGPSNKYIFYRASRRTLQRAESCESMCKTSTTPDMRS